MTNDGERTRKNKKEKKERDQATDGTAEKNDADRKKEKKKDKHRKRKQLDPADLDTVLESPPEADKSSKKDRKRKRETEVVDTAAQEHIPKSNKKKRHDANIEDSPRPVPPTPAPPPSSEGQAFLDKHSIIIHAPPSIPSLSPVTSFDQLDIPAGLRVAFEGFKEPTPIQAVAWPWALAGKDVVGIAETGSGKTLAFGIPALSQLISIGSLGSVKGNSKKSKKSRGKSAISVLVVAPIRELAIQTHDTLSALGAPFGVASVAVYGGVDKSSQVKALSNNSEDGKTTRIVVGTPGRILDLVNDGVCDLSKVNYLVLDEADRMLDKGFENDITAIISHTMPASDRQTMMFSATWPENVRRLASTFLRDPVRVTVGSDDLTANSRVEQCIEVLDNAQDKDALLAKQLALLGRAHQNGAVTGPTRILVFALYKKEASRVEATLKRAGHDVGALHGDMAQTARMAALEWFKSSQVSSRDNPGKGRRNTGLRLLVATDVAARGLDIPEVEAVVNYTFPLTIEDYVHRIGRTGRGGRSGRSITFFTGDAHERALAGELARVLRDAGFGAEADKLHKFPMTIKKKAHSAYGAFFRDDVEGGPTKIVF
ncbi:DEAD-domain-containing protein [Pisolithus croceorrhizus]|nr:DEAD-domain-containing protein [Pisolithus croceorrhizus]